MNIAIGRALLRRKTDFAGAHGLEGGYRADSEYRVEEQARVSAAGNIVRGIDHLIVMVGDLDRSERTWRELGFHTTPRGFHQSGGTANHLIMLDQTYIELLGLAEASADSPYRQTMLENPGLAGLALRGSAAATYEYWLAQGLKPAPPEGLARGVEIAGRPEVARFGLTKLPGSSELPFLLFCCDQLTPQFVWQADAPPHPNGARNLRELVIVVDDAQAPSSFGRVTGRSIATGADEASLALGESRVTFLSPAAFLRRFGSDAGFRIGKRPVLAAVVLGSTDMARARRFGSDAGFRVRDTSSGGFAVHVPPEGVVIEWTPA
ncbi:MAG TPA: VOC family protein [Steroidobacteraceae bacterium]|nr:VOC family protein [Steroidobacteraceae bacterium]